MNARWCFKYTDERVAKLKMMMMVMMMVICDDDDVMVMMMMKGQQGRLKFIE